MPDESMESALLLHIAQSLSLPHHEPAEALSADRARLRVLERDLAAATKRHNDLATSCHDRQVGMDRAQDEIYAKLAGDAKRLGSTPHEVMDAIEAVMRIMGTGDPAMPMAIAANCRRLLDIADGTPVVFCRSGQWTGGRLQGRCILSWGNNEWHVSGTLITTDTGAVWELYEFLHDMCEDGSLVHIHIGEAALRALLAEYDDASDIIAVCAAAGVTAVA